MAILQCLLLLHLLRKYGTNADVSEFFEEYNDDNVDEEAQVLNNPPPPYKKFQLPVCNRMLKQLSSPNWSREMKMNSTINSSW